MIVQLMLNKWVFNGVMVATPEPLHGAAQGGVHIKAYQSALLLQLNSILLICVYILTVLMYSQPYQSEPVQCLIN